MSNTNNNINEESPFHKGELAIQTHTGKREAIAPYALRAITTHIPDQHREFYNQLPFFVIGSVDNEGWPWASIVSNKPGFLQSPDPSRLDLNTKPLKGDPLNDSIETGKPLGLLGIDITSRRRNRLNATVSHTANDSFSVKVDQAFGNCPQYIQLRSVDFIRSPDQQDHQISAFTHFDDDAIEMISSTDTFFVSSFLPLKDDTTREGVDVSHRGGKPGFLKIEGNTITVPDYPGNYLFNTLGNFLLNPKAGLIFPDFETGDLLMLTGTVEIFWEDSEEIKNYKGAERAWRFTLSHGLRLSDALAFRSKLKEYSPNTLITGNWKTASEFLSSKQKQNQWLDYEITHIEDESTVIRSFYLKPIGMETIQPFSAGQFLTLRVSPNNTDEKVIRTYTVSSTPDDDFYRISVKREPDGLVSKHLHDTLSVGNRIQAKHPSGNFFIDPAEERPAVLLAGGVGITPMISMAKTIANHGILKRHLRPLRIFHSAQTTAQRAFSDNFRKIEKESEGNIRYYSLIDKPAQDEKSGKDYNGAGYITIDILRQALPLDDYDFYLCGPAPFMQSLYDTLITLGVDDEHIYAESFGPAQLKRKPANDIISPAKEAEHSIIKFTQSQFEQRWNKGDPTILEVAEDHGLNPNFSCRNGMCGSCAVKLKSGSVTYRSKPSAELADDEVLICCAVPAEDSDTIELKL